MGVKGARCPLNLPETFFFRVIPISGVLCTDSISLASGAPYSSAGKLPNQDWVCNAHRKPLSLQCSIFCLRYFSLDVFLQVFSSLRWSAENNCVHNMCSE